MNSNDELRMQRTDDVFAPAPAIPLLAIDEPGDAVPLARALVASGLKVLAVRLRGAPALAAIERITAEVPEACVGAAGVLDIVGLKSAIRAGARFAIAPGATEALYDLGQYADIPLLPGLATASEVMRGMERGWRRFLFFPAATTGAIETLQALADALPEARFCAAGGLDAASAAACLALANVDCAAGDWMAPAQAIQAGDWERIGRLAQEAACLQR